MLDGGIIQRLLEEKWKTFARVTQTKKIYNHTMNTIFQNQFLKRLLILVVHLLFLSLAVYLRPDDPDESLLLWAEDVTVIARYANQNNRRLWRTIYFQIRVWMWHHFGCAELPYFATRWRDPKSGSYGFFETTSMRSDVQTFFSKCDFSRIRHLN